MSFTKWKDKTDTFKMIDARGIQGNFFQGIKKQAAALPEGAGMEIVQSFDPIPLYEVMEDLGFEYHTEQKADAEYHAYFYRTRVKQEEKAIPDPLHSTIDLPENVSGQCIIYILRNIIGM